MVFLDASALVKRYVEEAGSDSVLGVVSRQPVAISRLSILEVWSAICRRWRSGDIELEQRDQVLASLQADEAGFHLVEIGQDVTALATTLLRRHALRASDSVQLASCLLLAEHLGEKIPFMAFDRRLLDAAAAEGVEMLTTTSAREIT